AALDEAATTLKNASQALDQATASALRQAAQALHEAAADLAIPNSLHPGCDIQPALSSTDHAAATEIRVRARQLDHWRRRRSHAAGAGGPRRTNPLRRLAGTRARQVELRSLIGRIGLASTSQNVSERRRLLVDSGYVNAADLAQEHGPARRARWAIPASPTP